ncbi:helix-turn-helix transcriptional regulator [Massilibacteroides vaginae]|uniref:helix-turn-helix transcriptional regulator n=1 Tax=Massilibacteroides vaginae TaxID=1673718 RepID=UPI000A1CA5C9|nr:hypothetical protein [Massilibacteroides vaginae]
MCRNSYITVLLLFALALRLSATEVIPSVFVKNYTVSDYKASCQNWGLSVTDDGILYVANNSGLLTFDGNSWKIHELPEQAIVSKIFTQHGRTFTSGSGNYCEWTRNEYGQLQYTQTNEIPVALQEQPLPFAFTEGQITATAKIDHYYFIGTARKGLFVTDSTGNMLLRLTADNLLQDNQIHDLLVQQDKRLWIAMDNGLALLTLRPPILLLGERSFTGKPERAFLQNDHLYLKSNLGYFKSELSPNSSFSQIPDKEARELFPPSEEKEKIQLADLFDDTEDLGSFSGTNRIYPISEQSCWLVQKNEAGLFHIEDRKPHLKCRILFDNFNLNLVNRGQSFIPLNDTLHLVSTMQGVVILNSRQILEEGLHTFTLPHLTRIEFTDNKRKQHAVQPENKTIELPHDFMELSLYAGTSVFTFNQQISYLVEGVSPDWSPWQKDGYVNLLQLAPGKYNIRIRSYAIRGPFPETDIQLIVRSPWYETWWAALLYLTIIALLGWGSTYRYLKFQKKKTLDRLKAERQEEQQRLQKLKNELLETELQNKNDELTRQTSAHVRKNNLLQSLIDELDQQKKSMGEGYPDRLYKKLRASIEKSLDDQEDWNAFETYFNSAHRDFTDRLRQAFPDITPGDIRVCCLLRMNLSTKEIALLLTISVRAVELRRYRLRKRLGLEGDINLTDFLMKF